MSGLTLDGFGFPGGTIVISGFTAVSVVDANNLSAHNFRIIRGFEGPQLILSWDLPLASFDEVILMRGRYDYPQNLTDGLILQTGVFTSYVDLDLIGSEYFFYTIFVRRGTEYFVDLKRSRAKAIPFETGETLEDFNHCLATVHKVLDEPNGFLTDTSNPINKTFQTSVRPLGERFHFDETQQIKFGAFQRFLRLFATQLDAYKGELNYLENFGLDPKNAGDDFLEALAGLIGWKFNPELTIREQRLEIENAVRLYKMKGTLESARFLIELLLHLPTHGEERHKNVLFSNQFQRRSLQRGLQTLLHWDTCEDKVARSWSPERYELDRIDVVLLCTTFETDRALTRSQVKKIDRVLADFLPATILGRVQITDITFLDTYPLSANSSDTFFDVIPDSYTEFAGPSQFTFMRSNMFQRTSNHLPGVSFAHSGVGEEFYDTITYL